MSLDIFHKADAREVLGSFETAMNKDRIDAIRDGLREMFDVRENHKGISFNPLLDLSIPSIGMPMSLSYGETSTRLDGRRLTFSDFQDVKWRYNFDEHGWVDLSTNTKPNKRPSLDMLTTFNHGNTFFNLSPGTRLGQAFIWLFIDDLETTEAMVGAYYQPSWARQGVTKRFIDGSWEVVSPITDAQAQSVV